MADASQSFHSLGRPWSYKSPARMMFMHRLASQSWRRRLARRRPHTGRQCGGGHPSLGRRRFDLRPASSRAGLGDCSNLPQWAAPIVSGRRTSTDIGRPGASRTKHQKGGALKRASIADFTLRPLRDFAGHSYGVRCRRASLRGSGQRCV
jgi:hypothetical protein